MLAVLLLAGCIVFDGTLSFEYEDFDDESYSYDDEAESESMYSVTDLARVRRFDPETVSTLNPEEVKGVLNQIMSGRNFDFISENITTTISDTESSKASDYDRFIAITKYGYDNLTRRIRDDDNITPRIRNEYDIFTPKFRNEYDNVIPGIRNENVTSKFKNEYDNLTPKPRNEYDNLTPMSRTEYDNLTPEFEIEYENSTTSTQGEYDSFSSKTNLQYENMGTRTSNEYENITLKPSLRFQPQTESPNKQMSESKMADASFHKAQRTTRVKKITNIEPEKSFSILRQVYEDPDSNLDRNPDLPPDREPDRPPDRDPDSDQDYPPERPQTTTKRTTTSRTTGSSTVSTTTTKRKRKKKTKTTTVTTTTTTTKTRKKTTVMFDVEKFLEIVANLTYDYYTNLTREVNETLLKLSVPTCGTPTTTTEPTTTPPTGPPDYAGMGHLLIGKCFVCGLDDEGIPYNANCADAFAGDFIPLVPQDPRAKGQIARFRKYCRYLDVNNFVYNHTMPRSIFGRWTGGCAVRWTDLTGVYTQRTCRNRLHATTGRHYASKRMAKLEMALNGIENGCIISPVATLLPLSRGISLFARFHACVCTGNWCNRSPRLDGDVWMTAVIALTTAIAPWSND